MCKEGLEICRNFVLSLNEKWKKEKQNKEKIMQDTSVMKKEWDV